MQKKQKSKSSFEKKTFIAVKCASCGKYFQEESEIHDLFENINEAIEIIEDSGWSVKGITALCEKCIKK